MHGNGLAGKLLHGRQIIPGFRVIGRIPSSLLLVILRRFARPIAVLVEVSCREILRRGSHLALLARFGQPVERWLVAIGVLVSLCLSTFGHALLRGDVDSDRGCPLRQHRGGITAWTTQ